MNKKFVATLALVLVAAMAFASVSFGGTATVGYKFTFDGSEKGIFDENGTTAGSFPVNASLSATTDYAKIAFRTAEDMSMNSWDVESQITLYLSKALADAGLELPVSLTAYIGNASVSGFYAYADPAGTVDDNYDGFNSKYNNRKDFPIGLDVGYDKYVTVRGIYDFFNSDDGFMVSAKSTPVDGVDVALSVANNPSELNDGTANASIGLNASAKVDIAALADLDFNLDASAIGFFGFGDNADSAGNIYLAAISGGYADIKGYVEYGYNHYETGVSQKHSLGFGASYNGIENLGLSAGLTLKDLSAIESNTLGYYVKAAYTLGGVTYAAKFCDINSKPGMKLSMSIDF